VLGWVGLAYVGEHPGLDRVGFDARGGELLGEELAPARTVVGRRAGVGVFERLVWLICLVGAVGAVGVNQ